MNPLATIVDWILHLHGWVALPIVFAVPALEASAFLGFLFPGEIAVLLGGVLAFEHRITLPAAIVAAVLGAIIGDTVGYLVGRRWGHHILRHTVGHLLFVKHRLDDHLEQARQYLRRRGGRALLVGRFTACGGQKLRSGRVTCRFAERGGTSRASPGLCGTGLCAGLQAFPWNPHECGAIPVPPSRT